VFIKCSQYSLNYHTLCNKHSFPLTPTWTTIAAFIL